MKTSTGVSLFLLALRGAPLQFHAPSTAFTCHGRLNDGANSAGGIRDLRLTIDDAGKHLGPMAQDFHAAFGLRLSVLRQFVERSLAEETEEPVP